MNLTRVVPVLAVAIAFILSVPALSFAVSASQVTFNFMCPCGTCDEALSTCECPESDGFRSQIAGMVGKGYTEEQVIQDFRGRFGPDVLIANAAMAPDSTGWNINRSTIGTVLLVASFSLVAFSLGRYWNPTPARAPARRRSASRPKAARSSVKQSGRQEKRHSHSEGEDLLEDHEI